MTPARKQSTKYVFVSYLDGSEWEAWLLRFNRGSKQRKPVKFFASREWRTEKAPCLFGATHWNFANERSAEEWFADQVAEYGGRVEQLSQSLVKKLLTLGFEPHNYPIHKPTPAGERLLARVIGTR